MPPIEGKNRISAAFWGSAEKEKRSKVKQPVTNTRNKYGVNLRFIQKWLTGLNGTSDKNSALTVSSTLLKIGDTVAEISEQEIQEIKNAADELLKNLEDLNDMVVESNEELEEALEAL